MSSDRASWSLSVRDVLRAVLRAPSRRSAVALISAAVQDFPCRILATHFDASAMVVIFAMDPSPQADNNSDCVKAAKTSADA